MLPKHLLTSLLLFFSVLAGRAQQTFLTSGGNLSGVSGSLSFSIGQVLYTMPTGGGGTFSQGVQQTNEVAATQNNCTTGLTTTSSATIANTNSSGIIQSFQLNCSGKLSTLVLRPTNAGIDSFGAADEVSFSVRLRNANDAIIATSTINGNASINTWAPGNTYTFDFTAANLTLNANTTYKWELYETNGIPNLILLDFINISNPYPNGFATGGIIPYPNGDINNWEINVIAAAGTTPPTITAGTIATCYPTAAAAEAAAIAATTATADASCPGTVTKTASTSGTCSAVVTVTATDACGNSSTVTYNTRIDGIAPTATMGSIAATYASIAEAEAAALAATTASDNCPGALTETVSTVGTSSAVITVTTTDACGNAAQTTYNTSINIQPTLSAIGNQTVCDGQSISNIAITLGGDTGATLTATSSNAAIMPTFTFGGSGANRTLTIATTAGQVGATIVTVTATGSTGATATQTFVLEVGNRVVGTPTVSTLAGGAEGFADGVGTAAQFNLPSGVAMDTQGNIYVADQLNHRIRKITPAGVVTTIAGSGTAGFADGVGTNAQFSRPFGITLDTQGNVYVADRGNQCIRKITPAGVVTTIAGSTRGFADGTGAAARFDEPVGVTTDPDGNVYVADRLNHRIRKITPAGVVTTIAGSTAGFADGTGINAQFSSPNGVTTDAQGNIYVSERDNHRIRKITPAGVVTTIAGSTEGFADGVSTSAQFNIPFGMTLDTQGNIYVADYNNHRVRKITSAGEVTTVAGSTLGFANGPVTTAQFFQPIGVVLDTQGNIYVADFGSNRIRKIDNGITYTTCFVAPTLS
ncbi:MAG: hypothetical protein ACK4UP_01210, partial [Spirosomataceae bacterium]